MAKAKPKKAAKRLAHNETICPNCGEVVRIRKDPALAAILSFIFFSLGQFYNGQVGKGVAFIALMFLMLGLMLMFAAVRQGWGLLVAFWLSFGVIYAASIYDAYVSAKRLNES